MFSSSTEHIRFAWLIIPQVFKALNVIGLMHSINFSIKLILPKYSRGEIVDSYTLLIH